LKHTKPPIVFIHGAFCGGWSFKTFSKPFAHAGYATHAPTLRHHGSDMNPPQTLATTNLTDNANDLEAFIAGSGATPIAIGHSLGSLLA